jgi:hypothetical protein
MIGLADDELRGALLVLRRLIFVEPDRPGAVVLDVDLEIFLGVQVELLLARRRPRSGSR